MLCLRPQEYALPPYLPSRFLSWKVRKLQQCTIQVHHSSASTGAGRTRMQLAKVVIASALVLAACAEGLPEAGALHRPQRSTDSQSGGNSVNTSSFPYIEVLRGRDGRDGRDGVPGPRGSQGQRGDQGVAGTPGPRNGGVVYTRWGKTSCPSVSGTTLVYAGKAGGMWWQHKGGAANYLCMPDDPDYLSYTSRVQRSSYVYGVEYATNGMPLRAVNQHNVPCAVCYASTRVAVTMIPAKTRCPSNWTLEYSGYLMSEGYTLHRTMYECVDKNPDSVPGSASSTDGASFYHVEASCNGMLCPPYDPQKELTCAVCTK